MNGWLGGLVGRGVPKDWQNLACSRFWYPRLGHTVECLTTRTMEWLIFYLTQGPVQLDEVWPYLEERLRRLRKHVPENREK